MKEPKERIKEGLETYIHGIEIDEQAYKQCVENLDEVAGEYGIEEVRWDIHNEDTLNVERYDGRIDYVVGNPPYVRVHNLDNYDDVKRYTFSEGGMTDLYLVFFEIGFNMLKEGGRLCYITPSSWINSVAGTVLRRYIMTQHNLVKVIDLEHHQPFAATTYTLIFLFEKGKDHRTFSYCTYNEDCTKITEKDTLTIEEAMIGSTMYLAKRDTLGILRNIFTTQCSKYVQVKNGFATLADGVFIGDDFPFEEFVIPTLKASTGRWHKALFPYEQ